MTALLVLAVPILPLPGLLALLPLLGVALNGTSTVLYGTVPETARGDIGHAFALFYTGVIGAGALAPIGYGALADATGRQAALVAVADCAGDDPARFRAPRDSSLQARPCKPTPVRLSDAQTSEATADEPAPDRLSILTPSIVSLRAETPRSAHGVG